MESEDEEVDFDERVWNVVMNCKMRAAIYPK